MVGHGDLRVCTSVCDVSGQSKEERAQVILKTQHGITANGNWNKVVSTENDMQWYSPHHPVEHPHKPGKVRRVCNEASKFKSVSLNDKILSGPRFLRNLVVIVFRLSENQTAITAASESMFLQVAVARDHCKVLRCHWR